MPYKAFMSYSHAADGKLAPALQSALHRFAKPWYRLRAFNVFRDKTSLAVTPALWPSIENALSDSEYFILMASPESAESRWVKQEVCWWIGHRSIEHFLIVLTEGELAWDESTSDFDWYRTTAVGRYLAGKLASEPLYVDLRWAKNADGLSLRHTQFRAAVLDLTAPLNGRPKDQMDGEDVRQHRRTMRLAWSAAAALVVLTIAALVAKHVAMREARIAQARQLAANANLTFSQQGQHINRSMLLAVESLQRYSTAEGLHVLSRGLALLPRRVRRISIPVSGKIRQRILSPGGYYLATVDMDHTVRVWEVISGRETVKLAHKEELVNLSFSPDGHLLSVILGPDWREGKTLIVLEAATGREAIRLTPEGEFKAMAWDPPGNRVAIACYEPRSNMTTARVLDVAGKREVSGPLLFGPEPGHIGSLVSSMAFSPDGKWLATGGYGLSQIWELADGHEVSRMRHVFPHNAFNSGQKHQIPESIETMVFSPDGRFLATSSRQSGDISATIWKAATGRMVARMAHPGGCRILAFSPDSRLLVTSTGGKFAWHSSTDETGFPEKDIGKRSVKVWDTATGNEVYQLNHDDAVKDAAFSPDGKWLSTSSRDNTARLWESSSGREVARLAEPAGVIATAFREDQGTRLVTISLDHHAQFWEAPPHQEVRLEHQGPVGAVAFSPDGKWLGTGSGDRTARLWEAATGREVARMNHPEKVTHLTFSPDGRFLATGMHGRWNDEEEKPTTVGLWEVPSGREIARLAHPRIFTCLIFSPDGSRLATGCGDGIIRMWETATGREMFRLEVPKNEKEHEDNVRSLAFSPDDRWLAAGYSQEGIRFWDLAAKRQLQLTEKKPSACLSLNFSRDGSWLAAGNSIGSTEVMETASLKKVADLPHAGYTETLIFHPTQPWLATGNEDYFARIWELPRGREVTRVRHGGPVTRVVFSPDGRFSASSEACPGPYRGGMSTCRALVRVWETATGVEVAQFPHEKGIDDVAFSPDGRLLASASRDGTARIWHWQPEDLIRQACGRLAWNLLQTEWQRYMGDLPYQPTCPGLPVPNVH